MPSAPLRDYGQQIHDLYLRRQLIDAGADLINNAFEMDVETPASQQIEAAEARLFNLAEVASPILGRDPWAMPLAWLWR